MTETTTGDHPLTYPSQGDPISPATDWDSVMDTFFQDISDYLDNLDATQINTLEDSNDNEVMTFTGIGSAVNYIDVSNSATGNDVAMSAAGDDTDVNLSIQPKGSGQITINGSVDYTWPTLDGTTGQGLQTDGSGNLTLGTLITGSLVEDPTPQLGGDLDPNGFEISGDWIPGTDSTHTLGSNADRWADLRVDNMIVQAGGNIRPKSLASPMPLDCGPDGDITCDAVTCTDVNLGDEDFDIYDEESFTPTIGGSSTSGAGTYTTQNGKYTLIGDVCIFQAHVVWTNLTGAAGVLEVQSLPFTANSSTAKGIGPTMTTDVDWTGTSGDEPAAYITGTSCQFYTSSDNGSLGNFTLDTSGSVWVSGIYKTT